MEARLDVGMRLALQPPDVEAEIFRESAAGTLMDAASLRGRGRKEGGGG